MPDLKVIPLRDKPLLSDIPGMLRNLANAIEEGKHGEVVGLLVVVPRTGDWPTTFGFGDVNGSNDPITQFELAKMKHCNMMMGRE